MEPARTTAVVDLLGVLAYAELTAFDRLAEDARMAPTLDGRAAEGLDGLLELLGVGGTGLGVLELGAAGGLGPVGGGQCSRLVWEGRARPEGADGAPARTRPGRLSQERFQRRLGPGPGLVERPGRQPRGRRSGVQGASSERSSAHMDKRADGLAASHASAGGG